MGYWSAQWTNFQEFTNKWKQTHSPTFNSQESVLLQLLQHGQFPFTTLLTLLKDYVYELKV